MINRDELLDAVEHAALQLKHLARFLEVEERKAMAELRSWPPRRYVLYDGEAPPLAPE